MANGECTVALLRSKHRVFSNTSCVFKTKMDLIIDRGSFYYRNKVTYRYVTVIKVNFIDRIHTKVLENGKNNFCVPKNVILAPAPCRKVIYEALGTTRMSPPYSSLEKMNFEVRLAALPLSF